MLYLLHRLVRVETEVGRGQGEGRKTQILQMLFLTVDQPASSSCQSPPIRVLLSHPEKLEKQTKDAGHWRQSGEYDMYVLPVLPRLLIINVNHIL